MILTDSAGGVISETRNTACVTLRRSPLLGWDNVHGV